MDKCQYKRLIRIPDCITYIGEYKGNDKRFVRIQNCGLEQNYICKSNKPKTKDIHLIAVAHVSPMHGFHVLVEALNRYYKKNSERKVYFHVVGDISGDSQLQKSTIQYGIEKYIIFHGFAHGNELDKYYDMADIGVNVLLYNQSYQKIGLTTLKTVEYTFKGLPQISCAPFSIDGDKTDIPDFLYIVRENSLEIEDIINFFDSLTISSEEIRKYAIEHMTWTKVLSNVFNTLR